MSKSIKGAILAAARTRLQINALRVYRSLGTYYVSYGFTGNEWAVEVKADGSYEFEKCGFGG